MSPPNWIWFRTTNWPFLLMLYSWMKSASPRPRFRVTSFAFFQKAWIFPPLTHLVPLPIRLQNEGQARGNP